MRITERIFKSIEDGLLCLTAAQSLVQAVGSTFPSRARMALTSLARGDIAQKEWKIDNVEIKIITFVIKLGVKSIVAGDR